MTCPLQSLQTDLLLDYSAGRLNAAKTAAIEQHLEKCPACASFRMEQRAVWDALSAWEPAAVSMDFNRRLWRRIDAAANAPWYRSLAYSLRIANWRPVVPLAAAMVVIAAGFLLDHPGSRNPSPGVSMREADQVEQTLDDIQLLHQLDAVSPPGTPDEQRGSSKSM